MKHAVEIGSGIQKLMAGGGGVFSDTQASWNHVSLF
jgi:hypothetical protein